MKTFIIVIFLYSKTLNGSSICDNNPCWPNSACSVSASSKGYKCSCYAGFIPPNCDDRDECSTVSNLCQNGMCVNNPGSYSCTCDTGYTGVHCEKQADPCLLNPCENGGTCQSAADGTFVCKCYGGFDSNNNCRDVDECSMSSKLCQNGTCVNNPGSYSCTCNIGYTGVHCEKRADPCLLDPCENGGTCQSAADGKFLCKCYGGFDSNNNCRDVDECSVSPGPCHNGACKNTKGSFECVCNTGYQGKHCTRDINECDKHPCNNNSACVNNAGSYKCMCYPGYGGLDCVDRDECSLPTSICKHGTCVNTPGSFECVCLNGYSGPRCKDINECLNSPCSHGLCINTQGSFKCKCNNGYQGQLCEEKVIVTSSTVSTTSKQVTLKVSLLLSSIFAFSSTAPFHVTSAKIIKTSLFRRAYTSTVPSVTSKTFLPTSYIHDPKTSSSSSIYSKVSKVYSSHSVQISYIITSQKSNNIHITYKNAKNNMPWVQNHWYIFVLVGAVLVAGIILVYLVVAKKRQRTANESTKFNSSHKETRTPTVNQIQQDEPLYIELD